ncbi:hypothetical protein LCGC14_1697030, partial [marine sediment metagenome]
MGMVAGRASTRIGKRSFDLFGFVDVVGFAPILELEPAGDACRNFTPMEALPHICQICRCRQVEHPTDRREVASWLCVQTTSSSNQAARKKKILESPTLRARAWALINSGHRVEVWGWISGRHAGAQAFRAFELHGATPASLAWHDKGVTEVEHEIIGRLTVQH